MDRLIEVVVGTNSELQNHLRPFMSTELVLNTTTRELRRGPGMWNEILPMDGSTACDYAVRVAVGTNVTIATGLNNNDSAGGVTLATGDKVLLFGQTNPEDNGIYTVGATPVRTVGYTTWKSLTGVHVYVIAGTYATASFIAENGPVGTVGTTAIAFRRIDLGALSLDATSPLNGLPTVTPLGTDLVLVQRADGSLAKCLISAIGTLVNV